jgi:hypothetical protein
MNDSILSSISSQLWKYYDIEIDIEGIYTGKDGVYLVYGASGTNRCMIKCKVFDDKVEDLYLFDGGEWIEPTTTLEEQELR